MSTRTGIEVALGLALLIAVYFFFTQSGTLSDTEAFLESANESSTEVAVSLSDAQDNATQFVETANEASTESAMSLADAQDNATQLADSANEASTESAMALANAQNDATQSAMDAESREANIVATATESAMQSADTISAIGTQNAETVSALEAESTEQAQILANTVATSSAIQTSLDESVSLVATQIAELETAQTTINEQATALAEVPVADTEDTSGSILDVSGLAVPDDFVLFRTREFELYVPPDYLVFDIAKQQDEAIEAFTELGAAYEALVETAEAGTEQAIVLGALNDPDQFISVDNLIITTEEIFFSIPLEDYLDGMSSFFQSEGEVIEQEVFTVNGREFGRMILGLDFGFIDAYVIVYVTGEGDDIYLMMYTTTGDNFEERQAGYEASLASFTIRE